VGGLDGGRRNESIQRLVGWLSRNWQNIIDALVFFYSWVSNCAVLRRSTPNCISFMVNQMRALHLSLPLPRSPCFLTSRCDISRTCRASSEIRCRISFVAAACFQVKAAWVMSYHVILNGNDDIYSSVNAFCTFGYVLRAALTWIIQSANHSADLSRTDDSGEASAAAVCLRLQTWWTHHSKQVVSLTSSNTPSFNHGWKSRHSVLTTSTHYDQYRI